MQLLERLAIRVERIVNATQVELIIADWNVLFVLSNCG